MKGEKVLFSSATIHWETPKDLYKSLNEEFHFTLDPCPLGEDGGLFGKRDGLLLSWENNRVFCNPPYGPNIEQWLRKAIEAPLVVYLLPVRTSTKWFHKYVLKAQEIRFLKGRLKFGNAKHGAPFESMIVIFQKSLEVHNAIEEQV